MREWYGPVVATEYRLNCNVRVDNYPPTMSVNANMRVLSRILLCHEWADVALDSSSATPGQRLQFHARDAATYPSPIMNNATTSPGNPAPVSRLRGSEVMNNTDTPTVAVLVGIS